MGKVTNGKGFSFTRLQKDIFDRFSQDPKLVKSFYFTGGTALSAIYLHHRESEDLDFFSERGFNNLIVEKFVDKIAQIHKFKVRFTQIESTRIFYLTDSSNKLAIKIDFNYYPYKRAEKGKRVQGVDIDSMKDIAINKFITISDRFEVKDYVDLFFLLKKFSVQDLITGVQIKFKRELDLVMIAGNFLKAEQFEVLPKMIVPLELAELRRFFRKKAREVGKRMVKE